MAEFWYHSTFDESVAIVRDIVARFPVRIIHLPREIDSTPATSCDTPELLDHLPDAVAEAQRGRGSGARLWLAIPDVTPPVTLQPAKTDPSLYVLANPQHLLSFDLGRWQGGRGMDAPLRCPNPLGRYDPVEIENVFDDVIEGAVKPKLVQADAGGVRYWLTPSVHEASKLKGGLVFGGVLPRRRQTGMGNPRIVHTAAAKDRPEGLVSAPRGSRPPVQIAYELEGGLLRARVLKDGPDEHLIELLEVLARVAHPAGRKILGLDTKLAFLLAEDQRFGSVRAPTPPRASASSERDVPRALARLCRDALLLRSSQTPLRAAEGEITWEGPRASVSYAPAGHRARAGFEPDERWTFVADAEQLAAIGKRHTLRISVTPTVSAPSEIGQRAELERIFKPLIADGTLRFERYGLPYDKLKPRCRDYFLAASSEARDAAFAAIVDTLETSLGMQLIRLDELRWALDEPCSGPGSSPRTARLPDRPSALADHARLAELVAALQARAAGVTMIAATHAGPAVRVAIAPEHSGTVLEEVLPYIRNDVRDDDPAASGKRLLFEIETGGTGVTIAVPRRALRAVPRLRVMVYESTRDLRAPKPNVLLQHQPEGERWALCVTRTAPNHVRSLNLHRSGACWISQRRNNGLEETFFCLPVEHRRFRSWFDALCGSSAASDAGIEVTHQRRYAAEVTATRRRVSVADRDATRVIDELEAWVERAHDV